MTVCGLPGVEKLSETVPSAFAAIDCIAQPRLRFASPRYVAIAFGSCSLPPAMWKRSSEAPKMEKLPGDA